MMSNVSGQSFEALKGFGLVFLSKQHQESQKKPFLKEQQHIEKQITGHISLLAYVGSIRMDFRLVSSEC